MTLCECVFSFSCSHGSIGLCFWRLLWPLARPHRSPSSGLLWIFNSIMTRLFKGSLAYWEFSNRGHLNSEWTAPCVCRCARICASGSSCRTVSYWLCMDDDAWFRNLGCGFCSNTEIKFQPRPVHLEVPVMNRDTVQMGGWERRRERVDGVGADQSKRELDITFVRTYKNKHSVYFAWHGDLLL